MRAPGARWVRAAGSGQFFTRWSWLATLPFAVTVMGGYDEARSTRDRILGFGIALAVHVVLALVGGLAAAAERAAGTARTRVSIVVVALAAIAFGRPLLLAAAATALDLVLFTGPLVARVATNAIVDTAALSLVAMVTVAVRSRRDVTAKLGQVLDALEVQRARDIDDVAVLSDRVLETTRRTLLAALPAAALRPLDPERAGLLLGRFADDVVRPLSHRLFDDTAVREPTARDTSLPHRISSPPARASSVLIEPRVLTPPSLAGFPVQIHRPAPVWITAIGYALLWTPYLAARSSPGVAVTAFLVAVIVGAAGNRIVARRPTEPAADGIPAIAAAVARYALVGTAVGLTASLSPAPWGAQITAQALVSGVLLSVVLYPLFAVLVSVVDAGFRRLAAIEDEVAVAVDEAASLAAASRNSLTVARRRVAHLLHSDVQAECLAAARELQGHTVITEAEWAGALDRIELVLARPWPDAVSGGAKQIVESILQAWRYGLELTLRADETAWNLLDDDPARLELAVDVIAEGLTNVIRHGAHPRAQIVLSALQMGRGVVVEVVSEGRIVERSGHDGYGLAQLERRARRLTLTSAGTSVTLRVEIA